MTQPVLRNSFLLLCVAVGLALSSGCAGRQSANALDAAREALADDFVARCAQEEYNQARGLLQQAEEASAAGRHREARRLAERARDRFDEARRIAEERREECEEEEAARRRAAQDPGSRATERPSERPETPLHGSQPLPDHDFVPVRFAFDSFALDDESQRILQRHAEVLRRHAHLQVIIEGHCDQHGSDEYNLALGERRARAVREYLLNMGIAGQRMTIVSYGSFMPIGSDAQNRRASFQVRSGP